VIAYHDTTISSVKLFPDVHETLAKLLRKGIRIAVISNGLVKKQWEKIFRLGIEHMLDYVGISGRRSTSASKILLGKAAMKALGLSPAEVLWVGDKPDTDIRSANALGITSVLIGCKKPERRTDEPAYKIQAISEVIGIISAIQQKK
jgi:putative hydrolase of the HAD superfamily